MKKMDNQPLFFAGSSHIELAKEISTELGIPLGNCSLDSFPDREITVEILEDVRGRNVLILQSLSLDPNTYLMELLILIDALKRSSAKRITVIIPYFGYGRQDRRNKPGAPITAKLVANLLSTAGTDHLITLDLHSDHTEGFFEIPITHLYSQEILSLQARSLLRENFIVVAPDIGSAKTAERTAKLLGTDLAVIKKERLDSFNVKSTLIGKVVNKHVLIVDDICSTAGTLIAAVELCRKEGAQKVVAAITHGLFIGDSIQKIEASALDSLLVTNTVPFRHQASDSKKINYVSVAKMIANEMKPLKK